MGQPEVKRQVDGKKGKANHSSATKKKLKNTYNCVYSRAYHKRLVRTGHKMKARLAGQAAADAM